MADQEHLSFMRPCHFFSLPNRLRVLAGNLVGGAVNDVTSILNAIEQGDAQSIAQFLPVVYQELRRVAREQMHPERADHTLQPTALVHEAYLRLLGAAGPIGEGVKGRGWDSRAHFFAAAAEAMRRILIEHARRRLAVRHGGKCQRVPLGDDLPIAMPCKSPEELLDLSAALDRLAEEDPPKARLVGLVFFAGLKMEEAASVLQISPATAYRHWSFARAWLRDAVRGKNRTSESTTTLQENPD
jgi:RNA polymerase sigma factor (TIGR02999 family)